MYTCIYDDDDDDDDLVAKLIPTLASQRVYI